MSVTDGQANKQTHRQRHTDTEKDKQTDRGNICMVTLTSGVNE